MNTPLKDEIESLSYEEIKWGEIMLVDPRDYTIHPLNARTEDPMRDSKVLEDSILEYGFRYPAFSDENKQITDGGRRLRIAMKHMIKLPMIHIRYGAGTESDIKKALDSILGNTALPNTTTELGSSVLNLSEKYNAEVKAISKKLGQTYTTMNSWVTTIKTPKEVIPPDSPEEKEAVEATWKKMTTRQRKAYERVLKASPDASPQELARDMRAFAELKYSEQDQLVKDKTSGIPVDVEAALQKTNAPDRVHTEFDIHKDLQEAWDRHLRARNYVRVNELSVAINAIVLGKLDIDPELYRRWGDGHLHDEDINTEI